MAFPVLLTALVLAGFGGDRFVRGSVGLGIWLRVPPGIIGATVAAFATSSPELTVGILSAMDGQPELAFGDATGSNMANLGMVLGIALLARGVIVTWNEVRREFLGFIAAVAILAISSVDGRISRAEAVLFLIIFIGWLWWIIRDARRGRSDVAVPGDSGRTVILVDLVVGIVLLIVAGRLIVIAAKEIGGAFGWSQFVVGSVIVALGTSAPELMTTVMALRRGHVGVGLGTVLGSNIFNSMFIIGVAGAIEPMSIEWRASVAALGAALVAIALIIPRPHRPYSRKLGAGLVAIYVAYLVVILNV